MGGRSQQRFALSAVLVCFMFSDPILFDNNAEESRKQKKDGLLFFKWNSMKSRFVRAARETSKFKK